MRKVFRVARSVITLVAMACSKAGDAPTSLVFITKTMSAMIDGVAWNASVISAQPQFAQPGLMSILAISGSGTSQQLTMSIIFRRTGTGTQTFTSAVLPSLSDPNASVLLGPLGAPSSAWGTQRTGGSGTVTVTVLTDDRVAGTFSFVAQGSNSFVTPAQRVVTNGQFDISPVLPAPP